MARSSKARFLLAAVATLVALLLPTGSGAAWTTNLVQLDNGTCGTNLQVGSDRTASASPIPTFFLQGDGGLSSYAMKIDGQPMGTSYSAGNGVVCVQALFALADGPHQLTGTELAPHAGNAVGMSFSIDTVAPVAPSMPSLASYKDTGVLGDGITGFRSVNVTGTAAPNEPVQIYVNGITVIAGARADANGDWSATSVNLGDGTYAVTAITLDTAGNRSAFSPSLLMTIDTLAPVAPAAPTLADGGGTVVTGRAPDDAATILIYSDGAQVGSIVLGRQRSWQSELALAPGLHTITVVATDAADNASALSAPLALTVGAPPQVAPPPPPPPPPVTPVPSRPAPPTLPRPTGPRPALPPPSG